LVVKFASGKRELGNKEFEGRKEAEERSAVVEE
jgi:hypothetical protein